MYLALAGGEWLEYARFKCDGLAGTLKLGSVSRGGTVNVADRIGFVLTDSLGRFGFSLSADAVSIARRFGTLGLLPVKLPVGGPICGRLCGLKIREEGGGEGARSSSLSTSCITCTGIDVKDFGMVSLVSFGIDEELRGGGIGLIGE